MIGAVLVQFNPEAHPMWVEEPEMKDYNDEYDKLSVAQKVGQRALWVYENRGIAFSWLGLGSKEICAYVAGTEDDPRSTAKVDISEADYLRGIDFWLIMRKYAEDWAIELARDYVGDGEVSRDDIDLSSASVDWFISEASRSDKNLWALRRDDPLLYGEICQEVSRQLSLLLDRIEGGH